MKTKCTFLLVLLGLLVGMPAWAKEVRFKKVVVDKTFRAEGVAVGDINRDGKIDVLAGDVWYAAPDWKMHEIRLSVSTTARKVTASALPTSRRM